MNSSNRKQVAIIGGSGFVGSYLVDALLEAGYQPSLLIRPGSEGKVMRAGSCRLVTGSLQSTEQISAVLRGCSAVIYCIGILREDRRAGVTFEDTQFDGVVRVADAAMEVGVTRFLLMSANGVRQPGTAYQETKYRAEQYVKSRELRSTVFRPSVIFGNPHGKMEFATQLYRDMIRAPFPAINFLPRLLPSSERVMLSPVHAKDVADAFVAALEDQTTVGRTYEFGGPEALTWRQTLARISDSVGKRKFFAPMPIPMMKLAATLFDWLPAFPVTRDQLTMLAEGNVAGSEDMAQLIGRSPLAFNGESLSYLRDVE